MLSLLACRGCIHWRNQPIVVFVLGLTSLLKGTGSWDQQASSESHENMLHTCWLCAHVGAYTSGQRPVVMATGWDWQQKPYSLSLLFVSCSAPCVVIWVCVGVYWSLRVCSRRCPDLICRFLPSVSLSSLFLSLFHSLILSFLPLSLTPPRQTKLVWQDLKPPPSLSLFVPVCLSLSPPAAFQCM